jgi:hypothetical protein
MAAIPELLPQLADQLLEPQRQIRELVAEVKFQVVK